MKFCCNRFESYYEDNSEIIDGKTVIERYPSIKIVKMKEDDINPFRFLFVAGLVRDRPPVINMAYCPFCGTSLFDFYKSDIYINDVENNLF